MDTRFHIWETDKETRGRKPRGGSTGGEQGDRSARRGHGLFREEEPVGLDVADDGDAVALAEEELVLRVRVGRVPPGEVVKERPEAAALGTLCHVRVDDDVRGLVRLGPRDRPRCG